MVAETADIPRAVMGSVRTFYAGGFVFLQQKVRLEDMRFTSLDIYPVVLPQQISAHDELIQHLPPSPKEIGAEVFLFQPVKKQVVQFFVGTVMTSALCFQHPEDAFVMRAVIEISHNYDMGAFSDHKEAVDLSS